MIRRYLISILCGLAALTSFGPRAGQAQSFDEAVRANVALGTRLCAQTMVQRASAATFIGPAGFTYRGVDRGVNSNGIALGVDHYFDAPADTVKVEVDAIDRPVGLCQVTTTHMDEATFAALVGAVLSQSYPALQPQNSTNWILQVQNFAPITITVRTIGTNNRYEAPGTVQLTIGFVG